jgi:hypothetical protein
MKELQRLPFVGLSIVPKRFKKVVFPPPDGPRMITNYPFLMAPSSP